ncbi:MAG: DUF1501 domain-containing protein [Pseudomonadales bacterium]|nr:DUF1501 domain-containing protein [Pseudomonadales bacterium]
MDKLVCIFQRGAADGLNSLVPYGDDDYYLHRDTIAVPLPGEAGGAIDLDGFYGLHPALAPLKSIYDANDMALIHAVGIPHGSRSHFSAQGLVERGVDDKSGPDTGWLGRHLSLNPPPSESAFHTVSISGNVPVSLQGATDPLAISDLSEFGFDQDIVDTGYPDVLKDLFHDSIPFASTAQAALAAMAELRAANLSEITPANGASYPDTALGSRLKQAAQLLRSELPTEVICIDSDGWDHHENLPTFLPQSLTELANSVAAFYTDMGSDMSGITLLVMTEFGRRIAKNGSVGTDHGTAGLAYAIGGGVNGGQIVSNWPGLDITDPELGEDLNITTDLRTVLVEMLTKRLGGTDIGHVFPGFSGSFSAEVFSAL